ncbi:MAG: GAF domain-containing protein, partial [Chloroflexi bacterium]|nr:GAF domain-containing protein [Chloroflexota bacterium]
VAVAIQNARLQAAQLTAEREARAQEVQALYEATKQITTSLDLTTTLNSILDAVVRLSESEVAGVALLDSGGTTLRYQAVRGPQAQPGHGTSFELGAGMIGLAVQRGEVLKLDDMPDEQRWLYRAITLESGIRSALFVPLRSGERVIGVLAALNREPAHFTLVRERLLIGLAEQATLAIIHASEVNERKRMATELEQQYHEAEDARNQLSAILDATNEAIILISPTGLILLVNRRFEELFGISAAAMLGRAFGELQAQVQRVFADPARFREQVAGTASDSEKQFFDLVRQRWPQLRDLALFSAPVRDLQGEHLGRLYLLRDVTRERELERVKEEMLQVVNHELRTPLSSLLGFTELLLSRHYSADQQREFLTIIHEEGQRLTTLIDDFLNLQRLESGVQQIEPVPTALCPLLERAVVAVGPDPARPIVVDVADDLPPVLIDPDRVYQVLANLLSNARKYSPGGGEVRLTAVPADGEVEVSVQDQGLGIPPEALPQLFRKFYRVDSSDRRSIKGTGLGLAIVKQIVEEHGGRIWVESGGPGQGSRFSFTLLVAELG